MIKYCPFCHCRVDSEDDIDRGYRPGLYVREVGLTKKHRYSVKCGVCGAQGPEAATEAEACLLWEKRGKNAELPLSLGADIG